MKLGAMAMKGYMTFPNSPGISGASLSDYLMSYLRPSTEMQSVYSTTPADWSITVESSLSTIFWGQLRAWISIDGKPHDEMILQCSEIILLLY